jgi:hypothetical protein
VNAQLRNTSTFPTTIVVEVAAFLAPKTHVRPDWYRDGPNEIVFAGSEVEGK